MTTRSPQARRPTAKPKTCPGCGSTMLRRVECDPPHHSRDDCLKCGRRGAFNLSPWTLERARAFVMPFGKFRGRSVGALADEKQGASYLRWAAENVEGNTAIAAGIALGLKAPEDVGGAPS